MHKRKQHASLLSSGWMKGMKTGFCSLVLSAQQTRMHKRKQHARLSSGWMDECDHKGGCVHCFWVDMPLLVDLLGVHSKTTRVYFY